MAVALKSSASKPLITLDEEVVYRTIISNTEDAPLENPVFKASISEWMTFSDGSFTVDGKQYEKADPIMGVNISDIPLNTPVNVSFAAIVNYYGEPYYDYKGSLTYDIGNPPERKTSESNIEKTAIYFTI